MQNLNNIEVDRVVREALVQAERELVNIGIAPFSRAGFEEVLERQGTHVKDLVSESVRVARRHCADTVSAEHVRLANENLLYGKSSRLTKISGIIGGVLFGVGASGLVSLVTTVQKPEPKWILLCAALAIIGAVTVGIQAAKEN